jgi:hypothetical protein
MVFVKNKQNGKKIFCQQFSTKKIQGRKRKKIKQMPKKWL